MITLESIVESIKLQLKPHLTDDVIVYDSWLIDMINQSRGALMRTLYTSGDNFIAFYQTLSLPLENMNANFKKMVLPTPLMQSIGKKNILYLGPSDMGVPTYHHCSLDELLNYNHHRFGNNKLAFADMGSYLQVKTTLTPTLTLMGIFNVPNDVTGYVYETSPYPIGENNVRQLEIITFQHIAIKLGMPVDIINNGMDETKNTNVGKQVQQQQEQEQPQQRE
jgi:hypothetical protein